MASNIPRIAQAVHADVIFVLEEGNIIAASNHADLLKLGGLYATLWEQSHGANINFSGIACA